MLAYINYHLLVLSIGLFKFSTIKPPNHIAYMYRCYPIKKMIDFFLDLFMLGVIESYILR